MRLVDKNFKEFRVHYVVQCLIATTSLGLILFYMDILVDTAVVASIGATSFIVFTMPKTNGSRPRFILGGYAAGSIVGMIMNYMLLDVGMPINIVGAVAVGLTMFIMVVTNTEHPPAAALALGLAINGYTIATITFVYGVAVTLLLIKWTLRKWLINLL